MSIDHQPLCSRCGIPCENPPVRGAVGIIAGHYRENVVLCADCDALSRGNKADRRAFWDGWEERLKKRGQTDDRLDPPAWQEGSQ